MQEMTLDEVQQVSGSGSYYNIYSDIKNIMLDLPSFYDGLIGVTVDIACRMTDRC